jgi:TM2 domain-containing membrane protein YozV
MENKKEKELNKDWVITSILCFFFWYVGIHRIYNGKIGTWILMLLTLWGAWIWWLIDIISLITWNFTRKDWTVINIKN